MVHRKKNDPFHDDVTRLCHSYRQDESTPNQKQIVNRLKIPQGLSTLLFRRWSEVPQGEGSAVVHRKKNYLLHNNAKHPHKRIKKLECKIVTYFNGISR